MYQSEMAQGVVQGDSDGSVPLATPAPTINPAVFLCRIFTLEEMTQIPIPSGSGELVADSERAGQVVCRRREKISACHWRRTINTGGSGGTTAGADRGVLELLA